MADFEIDNKPFGFKQGDPLIISYPDIHLVRLAKGLEIRAYYCTPFSPLSGRSFGRAIIVRSRVITMPDYPKLQQWIIEAVVPKLPPATLMNSHIFWV